jgi:PAS domain S-box-containing protein
MQTTIPEIIKNISWGTHICIFYKTKDDLINTLIPYFKIGLENNEFCMWITSHPLHKDEAEQILQRKIKDFDTYINTGQIEILDYSQWYTKSGRFNADTILKGWIEKEQQALQRGFRGLRLSGNTFWLKENEWQKFTEYEETVNNVIDKYKITAICTYSLDKCSINEIIDVTKNHQISFIHKDQKWKIIKTDNYTEIKEKELLQDEISANVTEGIVLIRASDSIIIYTNPQFEKMFGYDNSELLNKHISIINAPKNNKTAAEIHEEIVSELNKNKRWSGEIESIKKDGTLIWTNISISTFESSLYGKVWVAIQKDITECKKHIEQIKTNTAQINLLFENAKDGIVAINRDGTFSFFNTAAAKNLGYTEEEFQKLTITDMEAKETREEFKQHYNDAIQGKRSKFQTLHKQKDGSIRNVEVAVNLLKQNNEIIAWCFWRDITELKNTLNALKESERKFKQLAENLHDVFWIREDDKITYVSPAYEEIWQQSCKSLYEKSNSYLDNIHPEDKDQLIKTITSHMHDKTPLEEEYRLIMPNGTIKWVKSRSFHAKGNEGKIRTVGTTQDITDRKKTEEELRKYRSHLERMVEERTAQLEIANEQLRLDIIKQEKTEKALKNAYEELKTTQQQLIQSSKMIALGQLAAGISHELNQPLTGIKGFAQACLLNIDKHDSTYEDLTKIIEQANRMNEIIKHVRMFARKPNFELTELNINSAIENILIFLRKNLKVHDIHLKTSLSKSLPKIYGNLNQLQQVFINLLNNAKDAIENHSTPPHKRKIIIKTSERRTTKSVGIIIQDTGTGIPQEIVENIFNPFFTTKSPDKGMGLGLSIVYRIIENHKGTITVKSVINKGTKFKIILPAVITT